MLPEGGQKNPKKNLQRSIKYQRYCYDNNIDAYKEGDDKKKYNDDDDSFNVFLFGNNKRKKFWSSLLVYMKFKYIL